MTCTQTRFVTRQRDNCEERVNEQYGYVASRIYRIEKAISCGGKEGFMPYYVSTGEEYFHLREGGFALPTIEEARAVLSTYPQEAAR